MTEIEVMVPGIERGLGPEDIVLKRKLVYSSMLPNMFVISTQL